MAASSFDSQMHERKLRYDSDGRDGPPEKSSASSLTTQPSFVSKEVTQDKPAARSRHGHEGEPIKFVLQCKCFWRLRSRASLSSECVGSIRKGTELVGVLVPEDVPQTYGEWFVRILEFEPSSLPLVHGAKGGLPAGPVYCLYRNSKGSGLVEVTQVSSGDVCRETPGADSPTPFNTKSPDRSLEYVQEEVEQNNATEEIPLTWKLIGQVEGIVQYFSRLAGSKDLGTTQNLNNRHVENAADVFAKRQRKQFSQASQRLKEVVGELDETARTACVRHAFVGLSPDVQAAFQRLHRELEEAAVKVLEIERQERPWRAEANTALAANERRQGVDLQHFLRLCHVLELTARKPEAFRETKQHLITFSQRYCQDLEQQRHNLRRRRNDKEQA